LHLATYVLLDRLGELGTLLEDVLERPFITVGLVAWLLLVPLAITSPRAMVKRLGFARWQRLHRLSYLVALLAIVHFVWRVKKDTSEPVAYGVVVLLLLAARIWTWLHRPARPH
jgi:sulfoxide reductase heme-binding subunit YedZ